MALDLTKGQDLNLEKDGSPIKEVIVGLGWDPAKDGENIDVDLMLIPENGDPTYFNGRDLNAGIKLSEDDTTGAGSEDGPDETAEVNVDQLAKDKFAVVAYIYEGPAFENIGRSFVNVVNKADNEEIAKFNMTENGGKNRALVVGILTRQSGVLNFKAVGKYLDIRDAGSNGLEKLLNDRAPLFN